MMNAAIGYFMHWDPCPILGVQPTVETAEIYSREMIAPMLRDVPVLADLLGETSVKTTGRTLLHKSFPGGVLSLVGANSGAGFAMIDRRIVAFDEVDRYPASAGDEGDPIALGEKRTETFWNRKIIAGSTPLIAGASRIEELFYAGDRRRYHVPCPHCGHMDFFRFNAIRGGEDDEIDERGHLMRWPKDQPDEARFMCRLCGCEIEERCKESMLERGEWRADGEFSGHASFHVWAAYSTSPNAKWGDIAKRFVAAKKEGPLKLKTVVNTDLGETWVERGEAPDWERLHQRREPYAIGTVPSSSALILTAGVDVQKDRLVYDVVAWAANKENWAVDIGEFHGDTALDATQSGSPWANLDELLERMYPAADGREMKISMMAVDSGYNTNTVYNWCRSKPMARVIAIKGGDASSMIGTPSPVDVLLRSGRRIQRGYRVWPVNGNMIKSELYGWLGLRLAEDGAAPPGYCHFPEYDEEFFRQLTAEHLVSIVNRRTHRVRMEWQVIPNRENHWLDTRIYARAAAAVLGLDRMAPPPARPPAPSPPVAAPGETREHAGTAAREHVASPPASRRPGGGWLGGRGRGGGWLGRKR